MFKSLPFLLALATTALGSAIPAEKRCTGTISSVSDVAAAKLCTAITINSFTVPGGTTLDLTGLLTGTVVTVAGDVTFAGTEEWDGPLFSISGTSVTFNGNSKTFDGQGASYWDGYGSNSGKTKPLFLKVTMSGTFKNLYVLNSPRQVFSVGNKAALAITSVSIDNTAGNALTSSGLALGHNTDCFDVSASNVTISGCTCQNQDDCLAINSGSNIKFTGNSCSGGHGISIGSIATGKTVSGVTISGNTVKSSTNGLRIKTIYGATSASVSNVVYSGNTVSGISQYGVVIEQDYENGSPTGTATNGVTISNVGFTGTTTTVAVNSGAKEVYVLCGSGSCTGTWDWSKLSVSGGSAGSISPSSVPITGFSI